MDVADVGLAAVASSAVDVSLVVDVADEQPDYSIVPANWVDFQGFEAVALAAAAAAAQVVDDVVAC